VAVQSRLFDFFFFQAEDGIRDFHVTGVQTCALPIFSCPWASYPQRHKMNSVNRVILIITLKISSFSITNYVALLNKRKTTARGVAVDKELQQNFNNLIIPDLTTVFPFPQESVQHPKRPYNRFRQP